MRASPRWCGILILIINLDRIGSRRQEYSNTYDSAPAQARQPCRGRASPNMWLDRRSASITVTGGGLAPTPA
jgi:hypothetical protein